MSKGRIIRGASRTPFRPSRRAQQKIAAQAAAKKAAAKPRVIVKTPVGKPITYTPVVVAPLLAKKAAAKPRVIVKTPVGKPITYTPVVVAPPKPKTDYSIPSAGRIKFEQLAAEIDAERRQTEAARVSGIGFDFSKKAPTGTYFEPKKRQDVTLPRWVTDFVGDPLKLSKKDRKIILPFYGKTSADALKQKKATTDYLNYVAREIKNNPEKIVLFAALPPALKVAGRGIKAAGITKLITKVPKGKLIAKRTVQLVGAGLGVAYSKDVYDRTTEPVFTSYKDGKVTTTEKTLPNGDIEITTSTEQIPLYRKPTGPEQIQRISGIFATELAPLGISSKIVNRGVKTGYKPPKKVKPKVKITTKIKRAGKEFKKSVREFTDPQSLKLQIMEPSKLSLPAKYRNILEVAPKKKAPPPRLKQLYEGQKTDVKKKSYLYEPKKEAAVARQKKIDLAVKKQVAAAKQDRIRATVVKQQAAIKAQELKAARELAKKASLASRAKLEATLSSMRYVPAGLESQLKILNAAQIAGVTIDPKVKAQILKQAHAKVSTAVKSSNAFKTKIVLISAEKTKTRIKQKELTALKEKLAEVIKQKIAAKLIIKQLVGIKVTPIIATKTAMRTAIKTVPKITQKTKPRLRTPLIRPPVIVPIIKPKTKKADAKKKKKPKTPEWLKYYMKNPIPSFKDIYG